MVKKPFWPWKGGRNNHEASSSCGPPPRPVPPHRVPAAAADAEAARAARNARRRAHRARVSLEVAQIYWEARQPLPWGDAHLPEGWHLNRRRVPVPPVPRSGRERTEEILRRRALLPPDLVHDPAYALNSELWDRWFELEHDHRRRAAFQAAAPEDYNLPPPEEEVEPPEDSDLEASCEDGEDGGRGRRGAQAGHRGDFWH